MKKINFFTATLIAILLFILNDAEVSFAQQAKIDSLFNLVETDKPACSTPCIGDTARITHLNGLARELRINEPQRATDYATQALDLAEKIDFKKGMAYAYQTFGSMNYYQGNYLEALDYNFKALKTAEDLDDKDFDASLLSSIGMVYKEQGDYPRALEFDFKALKMKEEIGNKNAMAKILGNIGVVYQAQRDLPKALDYFFKALKVAEEVGDKNGVAIDLGNIGIVYYDQKDLDKALEYYLKALKAKEELGNKISISKTLGNIGLVYRDQNNFDMALDYYLRSLKLVEELGDKNGIAANLGNLGSLYTITKDYAKAEKYLSDALEISHSIGALDIEMNHEIYFSELFSNTNRYQLALEHYKKAMTIKDSLFNDEKNQEITRKEMNYEFEKKEAAAKAEQDKKDALNAADLKKQTLIRNITIGAAIVAALLVFVAVRSVNRRKKLSFEKTVSEVETKALRSQMNPHFISNSLQSINKYIIDNEKENASEYLSRFAKLMRMILENSREAEVTIEKDLQALELYLQLESLRFKNKFKYEIEVGKDIDSANTMIPPLLLQPFVENSILHGLRTIDDGMIKIKVNKEGSMIRCTVEDNGIGREQSVKLEAGEEKRESLGMKITLARLEVINQLKKVRAAINVLDLKNNENIPAGLRVELLLPFETAF